MILRPGIVIGPGSPPAHLGVGRFASETRVDFWGDGTIRYRWFWWTMSPMPWSARWTHRHRGPDAVADQPAAYDRARLRCAASAQMGSQIDARSRSAWRYWAADLVKELAKNAVRHPNRRWPSLHDWHVLAQCALRQSHDRTALDWRPVADRETMEARGIAEAVRWFMR